VSDAQQTPTTGSDVDPFAPSGPYWGMPDDPDERWREHPRLWGVRETSTEPQRPNPAGSER
jgi:hypothetical protein